MTRIFRLSSVTLGFIILVGCGDYPRLPVPEDKERNGCDINAPFGAEFCEGDYALPGAILVAFEPDEVTATTVEYHIDYRSRAATDGRWVQADKMVVLWGTPNREFLLTVPNAPSDAELRVYGDVVFEGITSKRLFCRDAPSGEVHAWHGEYELDVRRYSRSGGCYLDVDAGDLMH